MVEHSSRFNNSKEIIRRLKEKFRKNPSERLAQRIEALSGEVADWSDADHGNGPTIRVLAQTKCVRTYPNP